jgi:hypothetical protein
MSTDKFYPIADIIATFSEYNSILLLDVSLKVDYYLAFITKF